MHSEGKITPVPLCQPQIPQHLRWEGIKTAAVRNLRQKRLNYTGCLKMFQNLKLYRRHLNERMSLLRRMSKNRFLQRCGCFSY